MIASLAYSSYVMWESYLEWPGNKMFVQKLMLTILSHKTV